MIIRKKARELIFVGLSVIMLLSGSCRESPRPVTATSHIRLTDENLMAYNRGIIKTEEQEIEDFLARYRWDVKQSSTGLRYLIYRRGNGRQAGTGMRARFHYSVRLLNGKLVYSSDSLGEKAFILGHGGVETGLEEGMLLLREGDRAKFIIPSYLAYGLLGDQRKIPPGATLVYDIELIELKTIN
ncbi:MAG: FKBP-type peptidyl-prolyl cis-trans isomerase [Bacteroidales bacterium]|nr:FKBP-type peptidyl-prolyl cis-trans isomerase [Bacteroidales bacterium]